VDLTTLPSALGQQSDISLAIQWPKIFQLPGREVWEVALSANTTFTMYQIQPRLRRGFHRPWI